MKTIVMALSLMVACIGISQLSKTYQQRQLSIVTMATDDRKPSQVSQFKRDLKQSIECFMVSMQTIAKAMVDVVFNLLDYVFLIISKMLVSLLLGR